MSSIPQEIPQDGILTLRTCIICERPMLVMPNSFGFVEQPSGRKLFAVYGLDGSGHSTLRGILDSNGSNFACLKCHANKWSFDLGER